MKADANLDFCNLYLSWIKQNIDQFKVSDNTFRLTMPFLDRNNDQIEIYITKSNGSYLITDDGATLNDLFLSGFEISKNSKRENILNSIVAAHGVRRTADNEQTDEISSVEVVSLPSPAPCPQAERSIAVKRRNAVVRDFFMVVCPFLIFNFARTEFPAFCPGVVFSSLSCSSRRKLPGLRPSRSVPCCPRGRISTCSCGRSADLPACS